jgi:hypothetical protein
LGKEKPCFTSKMLRAMESDFELASLGKEKQNGDILRAIKATAATTYTGKSKYIASIL